MMISLVCCASFRWFVQMATENKQITCHEMLPTRDVIPNVTAVTSLGRICSLSTVIINWQYVEVYS